MGTGGLFLRRLRAKVADEPTGFVWVEQGKLAGSGYPSSRSQVEWLVKSGIRSILTLTEEPLPEEWTTGFELVTGHVAMKDHQAPDPECLGMAVDFLAGEVGRDRPVLVHCLAGEGRTGCVLAAYLVRERGMGAEEALKVVRESKPEFVEQKQEGAICSFASIIKRSRPL